MSSDVPTQRVSSVIFSVQHYDPCQHQQIINQRGTGETSDWSIKKCFFSHWSFMGIDTQKRIVSYIQSIIDVIYILNKIQVLNKPIPQILFSIYILFQLLSRKYFQPDCFRQIIIFTMECLFQALAFCERIKQRIQQKCFSTF